MRHEDDLTAALRTLERHAPDPDRVLNQVRERATRRHRGWRAPAVARVRLVPRLAPLAAALAVVALAAGSILLANGLTSGSPGVGPIRSAGLPGAGTARFTADGLPAYYIEYPLSAGSAGNQPGNENEGSSTIPKRYQSHETLSIVATATGKVTATPTLPGYVSAIAASNGAFFAEVVRDSVATFYEIGLGASGTGAKVIELPVPPDTAPIAWIAASPDGSKLAYATLVMHGPEGDIQNLVVASTITGHQRHWATPARDDQGSMDQMYWLDDNRTLAFSWTGAAMTSPSSTLRLLNTSAGGGDLMASRPVLRLVNSAGTFDDYTISPDGKTAVGIALGPEGPGGHTGTIDGRQVATGAAVAFSLGTGQATVLYTPPLHPGPAKGQFAGCSDPLWVGASGRTVLLDCFQQWKASGGHQETALHTVLLRDGHATQLPWLAATAGQITAFPGVSAIGDSP
jgi:hypothetical protein